MVSIKGQIREDSGLDVALVYYCAGYEEVSGEVVRPYNLSKFLYYILNALPAEKRAAVFGGMNTDTKRYAHNDDEMDYNEKVRGSLYSLVDYVAEGINNGAGRRFLILGAPGAVVGIVVGAFLGGIKGILNSIF